MSSQHNNTQLEVKLLQRSRTDDLNVMLLETFFRMKFTDKLETVLGEDELFDKAAVTKFEKEFVSKCFFCGCVTELSGTVITHFIIRKASLADIFAHLKRQFIKRNMTIIAAVRIVRSLLNGLQPHERILIYDDSNGNCDIFGQSITDDRITAFIDSFKLFSFFSIKKQSKHSDSLDAIYGAIKKTTIGKNVNVRFFYTVNIDNYPKISNNNYEVISCTKKHRKTYRICPATQFIQEIKDKASRSNRYYRKFYAFVGL